MTRNTNELKSKTTELLEKDNIKILEQKLSTSPEIHPNFKIQKFTNKRPLDDFVQPIAKKPNPSTHNLG